MKGTLWVWTGHKGPNLSVIVAACSILSNNARLPVVISKHIPGRKTLKQCAEENISTLQQPISTVVSLLLEMWGVTPPKAPVITPPTEEYSLWRKSSSLGNELQTCIVWGDYTKSTEVETLPVSRSNTLKLLCCGWTWSSMSRVQVERWISGDHLSKMGSAECPLLLHRLSDVKVSFFQVYTVDASRLPFSCELSTCGHYSLGWVSRKHPNTETIFVPL